MKFLITTEHYCPKLNGVQIKTQQLCEYLIGKGHNVEIVTSIYPNFLKTEIINGVLVTRMNLRSKKSFYLGEKHKYLSYIIDKINEVDVLINIAAQNAFTDLLLKHVKTFNSINILYFHGMANFSFPNVPKIDLYDIVYWLFNISRWKLYYFKNKNRFQDYDFTIHLHKIDKTLDIVKSSRNRKLIFENVNKPSNKINIYSKKYLLSVSNYSHDKNQLFVLEAYYKSNTERQLIFVGSEQNKYYHKLIKAKERFDLIHGPKDVEFISNENREKTLERFDHAFLFLFGSKHEKYPTVISESMSSGLPYITTNVGIVKELEGGITVNSIKEMSKAIDDLEQNKNLYKKLASSGIKYSLKTRNFEDSMNLLLSQINELKQVNE